MAYPGAYPGARTFPGVQDSPWRVEVGPPPQTVDEVLAGTRRLQRRVTVLREGRPVLDGTGAPVLLPVIGGSITVRDGLPTREISCEVSPGRDREWIPTTPGHLLDPETGCELLVEATLTHRDIGTLTWPLGVFDLGEADVTLKDDGRVGVSLSAPDRSQRVATSLMLAPHPIPQGVPPEVAMQQIITATDAGVPVRLAGLGGIGAVAVMVGEPGADPLAAIGAALGKPTGLDVRVTADGQIEFREVADPATAPPAWTWEVGAHPILTAGRRLRRQAGAVIVPWTATDEDTGLTSSGVVVVPDEAARPRQWWDGDASTITTADQARAAGHAWLTKRQVGADAPSMSVLLDPRIDVGDVVQCTNARIGLAQRARVVGLDIPLDSDVMSVTLANRRQEER